MDFYRHFGRDGEGWLRRFFPGRLSSLRRGSPWELNWIVLGEVCKWIKYLSGIRAANDRKRDPRGSVCPSSQPPISNLRSKQSERGFCGGESPGLKTSMVQLDLKQPPKFITRITVCFSSKWLNFINADLLVIIYTNVVIFKEHCAATRRKH